MEFYYYTVKFKIFLPIIKIVSIFFRNKTLFKTKEFKYSVPIGFDSISKFLMNFGLYETKERSLIEKLNNKTHIIEAGAGIGLISMYLNRKVNGKKLIMLEPNKKMNSIIKNNFKLNSMEFNNVILINKGLSESDKKDVTFQKFESDMANTISQNVRDYNLKKKDVDLIDTISINTLIYDHKLDSFQIVLDIEGEENNVLKLNNSWLKKCESILLENHLPQPELIRLNEYIVDKGFKLIDKKENVFLFKKK